MLLRELLRSRWPSNKVSAVLDRRGEHALQGLDPDLNIHWVASSLGGRWRAEKALAKLATAKSLVLCFHNLPPIFPIKGRVVCYVQNANLVGIIPTSHLSGWLKIRYAVERFIARRFRHRIGRYAVQTLTMATALRDWYGAGSPPIDILPFAADSNARVPFDVNSGVPIKHYDFIYVSDGSFHKNHSRLFAAWRLLANEGVRPSLAVTLHPDRDTALRSEVQKMADEGLAIEDLGFLPHSFVLEAYRHAGAMIFPSYAESFGIPLIEASNAGLPIIASELDYVRDVCDPVVTFDPSSPRSIARAVQRFLNLPNKHVAILSGDKFVAALCAVANSDIG